LARILVLVQLCMMVFLGLSVCEVIGLSKRFVCKDKIH
jgi:hypothetical protein